MIFKNLKDVPLSEIVNCLTESFSDYQIKMPEEVEFWRKRWKIANVDYSLSYGAFENNELVGFIINGIGRINKKRTAFNTGTGVKKQFRGLHIPSKLYEFSIPFLKKAGISYCSLEVITSNDRAIHVYEKIGFKKLRQLDSFTGDLVPNSSKVKLKELNFADYFDQNADWKKYSWDFNSDALRIAADKYSFFEVWYSGQKIGSFVIDTKSNTLAQYYTERKSKEEFQLLFHGIASLTNKIRIVNLHHEFQWTKANLITLGLNNNISQYEMGMDL